MHKFSVAPQFEKEWMASTATDSDTALFSEAATSLSTASRRETVNDKDEAMVDVAKAPE